jgi:hypothetical protein
MLRRYAGATPFGAFRFRRIPEQDIAGPGLALQRRGRALRDSSLISTSERAARQQLSRQAGRSVGLEEAARHLHHTRAGGHLPRFAAF